MVKAELVVDVGDGRVSRDSSKSVLLAIPGMSRAADIVDNITHSGNTAATMHYIG